MREFLVESQERGIAAILIFAAVAVLGLGILVWLVDLVHRAARHTGELIRTLSRHG